MRGSLQGRGIEARLAIHFDPYLSFNLCNGTLLFANSFHRLKIPGGDNHQFLLIEQFV